MDGHSNLNEPLLDTPHRAEGGRHLDGPSTSNEQRVLLDAEGLYPVPGLWRRLTFGWVDSLLQRGATRAQLEQEDLPPLPQEASPSACSAALRFSWWVREIQHSRPGRPPSLLRALFRPFGTQYLALGFLKLFNDVLNFAAPVFLNGLLRYLDASKAAGKSAPAVAQLHGVPPLLSMVPGLSFVHFHLDPSTNYFGAACAALLVLSLIVKAFLNAHLTYRQGIIASKVRSALTGTVFSHTLSLRESSLATIGMGRVQTLMSVDTDRFANLCLGFHDLWSIPLQICIALWMLYTQVQFAFLAGLVGVLLIIPLNKVIASAIIAASIKMMAAKDQRVTVIAEMLKGVKAVKAYAWESVVERKVQSARKEELRALATKKYLDAMCVYLWAATSLLFSLGTFGLYALLGKELTAESVFTSLALFNTLLAPINMLPWVINGAMESVVSLRRMQDFLVVQSSTAKPTTVAAPPQGTDPLAIDIRDAEFAWGDGDGDEEAPAALQHINLDVPFGTFVAIAGDVGSGKSSLLGAILGELRCSSGTCAVNGTVAFVPQTAWLMPASVRENVLLGAEYDVQRYRQVLHACALEQDLHSMPAGDATLVGESGSTLSGGQRARVALARALYHANTADIILLDDVLAAVDAHVAAWLVEHALKGPLLHGKTVIAATHSPLVLAAADVVVTIESGSIVGKEERATQRKDTSSASSSGMQSRLFKAGSEVLAMLRTRQSVPVSNGQALPVPGSDEVLEAGNSAWATSEPPPMDVPAANQGAELGPLQEEEAEEREIGHVKWHVYKRYMSLQGMWVPVTLVSLTLMQGTRNGSDLWLSYWVSHTDGNHTHASSSTNTPAKYDGFAPFDKSHGGDGGGLAPDVKFYLTVLLVLGAANSVFTLVRAFAFAIGGLAAARRIHCRLLSAVLAVPPTFFDSTPSGRILNRFSSDTATVDDGLPFIANIFLAQAFALAGALVVVGLTQPYLAAVFLPLTLVYRSMQQYYRSTSRELRRLDAVAKSPLYSLFSCALSGGPTLRAFRATPAFLRAGLSAVAAQQRAALASLAASAWLGLRLQLMAAVIAAGIAGLAVAQSSGLIHGMAQSAAAGFVGLSLAYVMPITGLLSELVSTGAETEQEMVAVERIEQYLSLEPQQEMLLPSLLTSGQPSIDRRSSISTSRGLAAALDDASQTICSPRTGLLSVGGHRAAPSPSALAAPNATAAGVEGTWPEAGAVSYSNVWLRYSVTGPFVVQHLTMHIPAGTKAGICGRTGAGKSSAVACLLRLAEVSAGEVIIDGVDVRQVPLKRLRSAIGYVPQSPFLFSGTIHENLDPMGRHSSDEVMTVLEHVGLWEPLSRLAHSSKALLSVQSEKAPLRLRLGEGGVSLSQGQQQMLCLARVLLQRPRIVCLDESTSSVDADSADAMHAVVAAELKGCTVIEIAHRLASLANSDVVYVMEGGQVVEQGNPRELVHKPESLFQKMVKEQHGSVVQAGCIAM